MQQPCLRAQVRTKRWVEDPRAEVGDYEIEDADAEALEGAAPCPLSSSLGLARVCGVHHLGSQRCITALLHCAPMSRSRVVEQT